MGVKELLFIADDDPDIHEMLDYGLRGTPHEVVLRAHTLPEALGAVPHLQEKEVSVAIIDANLAPGDNSGKDGKTLAAAIRSAAPEVTIVEFTSSVEHGYGDEYVSKQAFRRNMPGGDIVQVLNDV